MQYKQIQLDCLLKLFAANQLTQLNIWNGWFNYSLANLKIFQGCYNMTKSIIYLIVWLLQYNNSTITASFYLNNLLNYIQFLNFVKINLSKVYKLISDLLFLIHLIYKHLTLSQYQDIESILSALHYSFFEWKWQNSMIIWECGLNCWQFSIFSQYEQLHLLPLKHTYLFDFCVKFNRI